MLASKAYIFSFVDFTFVEFLAEKQKCVVLSFI